jgi:hypothetical protein
VWRDDDSAATREMPNLDTGADRTLLPTGLMEPLGITPADCDPVRCTTQERSWAGHTSPAFGSCCGPATSGASTSSSATPARGHVTVRSILYSKRPLGRDRNLRDFAVGRGTLKGQSRSACPPPSVHQAPLAGAFNDLDSIPVRVADEGDEGTLGATAGTVGRLLRLDALLGQLAERAVEVVHGDRDVVVARA